jgi:hypothetical protein
VVGIKQPNPFIGKNYYDIDSKMAIPPAYWLERLYDFDADLVVFPSQQVPFAYCLARRARRTAGINTGVLKEGATPDTKMCLKHHLLPVTIIYRHNAAAWSIDNIISDLKARDTWAMGGSKKVADVLDAQDEQHRAKVQARHSQRLLPSQWRCVAVLQSPFRLRNRIWWNRGASVTARQSAQREINSRRL